MGCNLQFPKFLIKIPLTLKVFYFLQNRHFFFHCLDFDYLSALDFCNSPPPILIFQGYQLCVLDYDFMILNNAFLIHRPGIKTAKSSSSHIDKAKVAAQNDFIKKIIMPELKQLYGTRKGCEK